MRYFREWLGSMNEAMQELLTANLEIPLLMAHTDAIRLELSLISVI